MPGSLGLAGILSIVHLVVPLPLRRGICPVVGASDPPFRLRAAAFGLLFGSVCLWAAACRPPLQIPVAVQTGSGMDAGRLVGGALDHRSPPLTDGVTFREPGLGRAMAADEPKRTLAIEPEDQVIPPFRYWAGEVVASGRLSLWARLEANAVWTWSPSMRVEYNGRAVPGTLANKSHFFRYGHATIYDPEMNPAIPFFDDVLNA